MDGKDKKSELLEGIFLIYLVLCFAITAVSVEKKLFTYGQISMIYLPLLAAFCVLQVKRYKDVDGKKRPSKTRLVFSVGLCIFMIALVMIYNTINLFSLLLQ